MKKYTAAQARQRLSELLDAAESQQDVIIERRGIRFSVTIASKPRRRRSARSLIEYVDPVVANGEWTWQWTPTGLDLAPRQSTRKPRDPARH